MIPEYYDIYEVEKQDYDAYFYRLPENEIMKTTPREGWVFYKDTTDGTAICGILTEEIMAMPANRYFIFNFIDESRLGPHKRVKYIHLDVEAYEKFLNELNNVARMSREEQQ